MVSVVRQLLGVPIPMFALAHAFDQFAVLLDTGMPINEAFRRASGVIDVELSSISVAVENSLRSGIPLHRALLPWKDRLPEIALPILEVGAISGTLDNSARRLGGAFGQVASLQRHYHFAIFNPWLVIACFSLYSTAHQFPSSLSAAVYALFSTFIQYSVVYIVGRLVLGLVRQWEPLRYVLDTIKLAIPGMGTVARNLAAARWGRSFATLWSCGVPISTALEVSAKSSLNAPYERALKLAARRTRRGDSLAECLATTQLLPSHLVEMVRTGELTGSLGLCVEQFAAELENEALTKASQQLAFLVTAAQIILIIAAVGSLGR